MRPFIALPGHRSAPAGARYPATTAPEALCEAVLAAGGEPLILHGPAADPADGLVCRLARFDGVLLTGGGDLDPGRYRQYPAPETRPGPAHDDALDLAVVAAVRELGLPALAICRGLQVVNVAFGGTLRQHLDTTVQHWDELHTVDVIPGSRLHAVTGREMLTVSSYHHQAVDRLGAGLTPTALSPDGSVEALEHGEILAVQWHPEDFAARSETDFALFIDLMERAAKTADIG